MTAEAEVFDQAATDPPMKRALARVRRVSRAGLYTEQAITAAAELLVDMEATGARHGITPDSWSLATDLPGACVDVTSSRFTGVEYVDQQVAEQGYPSAAALAIHLVDVLHQRLADELGITSTHRPGSYSLTFNVAGGRYRRGVRAGADGWQYDTDGAGPVTHIYAPYTEAGARGVADLLAELVQDNLTDPFVPQRGRSW